jgi:hypothetical protein
MSMSNYPVAELSALLEEALLERNFQFPLVVVAVAANGSVAATRFQSPQTSMILAEHLVEPEGLSALPLHVMIVDTRNEMAAAVVGKGVTWLH